MDMGLTSDSLAILSFFGIGVILAIFHTSGKKMRYLCTGINNVGKQACDDICHWFDEFNWNLIWAGKCIILNPIYLPSYLTWCNQPQLKGFLFRF